MEDPYSGEGHIWREKHLELENNCIPSGRALSYLLHFAILLMVLESLPKIKIVTEKVGEEISLTGALSD